MTATELSNRRRTIESRLREMSGSDFVTMKQLQAWFGASYRTVKRQMEGVPHLAGSRYHIADVANKIVQSEER